MLTVLTEKLAAQPMPHMRPLKLDLATDPPPDERYDLIYSLMTFHHIADTDKILADLFALLTPGGYLCIADLDSEDGSFHGPDFDGHKDFDRDDLGRKATHAGFRSVGFRTVFRMTKSVDQGQNEFPVFLMVARK
jgi:2-polyprenyl-3-methyl-5-hydroxy-6-metoxy-1,4-benzoquinol methylase